jgi:hypothetical protein
MLQRSVSSQTAFSGTYLVGVIGAPFYEMHPERRLKFLLPGCPSYSISGMWMHGIQGNHWIFVKFDEFARDAGDILHLANLPIGKIHPFKILAGGGNSVSEDRWIREFHGISVTLDAKEILDHPHLPVLKIEDNLLDALRRHNPPP